jgi:tetratricopeptide (TPR) repeat protein
MRPLQALLLAVSLAAAGFAQNPPPRSDDAQQSTRNPNESSSKDTRVDISPPPDDSKQEGSDLDNDVSEGTGVREMKPWNPHKAMKDIEVGDYYFKQKNYRAAISRYREALEFKPKDAEATFKLAVALEKAKQYGDSAAFYRDYVKNMPDGVYVADAQKALERLGPRLPNKTVPLSPLEEAMANGEKELRASNFGGALFNFNKVLEIEPENALATYKLAVAMEGGGDANEALRRYYHYLQLAPGGRYSADAAAAIERLKKQGATISQSVQTPR